MNTLHLGRWTRTAALTLVAFAALVVARSSAQAEESDAAEPAKHADTTESAQQHDTTKLAKETQNPVADLISVPFQNNFNFNAGTKDEMVWVMNIQPVIPIHLTENWNLITRTIVPIIDQPSLAPGMESAGGMGDINPSVFLSPAKAKGFIWGVGVTTTLPTATASEIGSGQWSMGPTAVALYMEGHWVVGALMNQQWSMIGWSDTPFNAMLIQPFVNYNIADGWYISSAPIITADFSASHDNHWTVPVGAGIGKLWRLGKIGLPLNTQIVPYYNAVTPDFGPDWQLRFQFQFLFPR